MKAVMKLDIAQGDDTDEQVKESLLDGVKPERITIEPTGSFVAGDNPEWKFIGDVRDLFSVLLNYVGIRGGDRELLNMHAHNITTFEQVDVPAEQ